MTEVLVKPASEIDCATIAEIYNHYLGKATMDLDAKTASYYQQWLQERTKKEALYILNLNDTVIGWGIIKKYSPKKGYQYAGETSVFLHPDFLRKGYGSYLKKFLLQKAKEMGYKHLLARIFADNTASIKYNQLLGYTIVGQQQRIGFVNNTWKDVVIMQYLID